MAKTWTPDEIKTMIATNDKAVARALLALLDRQTADEQASQTTSHSNGQGFTGADAEILTSFAQQVQRGRTLSVKQLEIARRKLVKYAKQLALVANAAAVPAVEMCGCGRGPQVGGNYRGEYCAICEREESESEARAENAWLIASETPTMRDLMEDQRERELEALESERMGAALAPVELAQATPAMVRQSKNISGPAALKYLLTSTAGDSYICGLTPDDLAQADAATLDEYAASLAECISSGGNQPGGKTWTAWAMPQPAADSIF